MITYKETVYFLLGAFALSLVQNPCGKQWVIWLVLANLVLASKDVYDFLKERKEKR